LTKSIPKRKLIVTGATGLVGSRFVQLFKNQFSIFTIGREYTDFKINLNSKKEVLKHVAYLDAESVINFAAYTNVDGAQKEKGNKSGEVYTLNSMLPLWLAQACKVSGKSLYHISTDYVFNGKKEDRPYTENEIPKPLDCWYSSTKFQGELNAIKGLGSKSRSSIIRISFPYSGVYGRKLDFARVIIDKLKKGEIYFGITDQKIKPVSVDDIAQALALLIAKQSYGIFHVAGKYSEKGYISPYEFSLKMASIMNLDKSLIKPVSFLELSKKRIAPRPQHTWLDTNKIEKLGFTIPDIDQVLNRFKIQINS